MTTIAFALSDTGIPTLYRADPAVAFDDLCGRLFASLPRSDQRRTGADYLWGLLHSSGRTSMRNLAALPGVSANGQSLHHFITNSSWDWIPVRRALAGELVPRLLPKAWVVHPFPVARRSGRREAALPVPPTALGVWAATETVSAPVSWRHPAVVAGESLGQALAAAVLEPVRDWGMPPLPAVLDARGMNPGRLISTLRAHGIATLVRVDETVSVYAARPGVPARPMSARMMADLARNRRRPVQWRPEGEDGPARTILVWADRVRLPGAESDPGLVLMSSSDQAHGGPAQLWLTDLTGARIDALFRLAALLDRVDRRSGEIADRFGLGAFAGRSPETWHRHATLASAAYALTELGQSAERRTRQPSRSRPAAPTTPSGR